MKIKYLYLAIVALALAACNSVEPEIQAPAAPQAPSVSLVLRGRNTMTKTAFGETAEGRMPLNWIRADRIGLFLTGGGVDVAGVQNLPVMIDRAKGPGQNSGSFRTKVTGLQAATSYDVRLYYPYFHLAGSSSAEIHNRVAPFQVQEAPGSSSHVGKSGGFATSVSHFATPASLEGAEAEVEFELSHKTSYLWLKVSAPSGAYSGMHLKRVSMNLPEGTAIAGETTYDVSSDSFSLTAGSKAMSNSIEVSIAASEPLSAQAQEVYMVVFPTSVAGKDITFKYTLQSEDGATTKVLSHVRTIGPASAMFAPGKIYELSEQIPASVSGDWSESDLVFDRDAIDEYLRFVVKACQMPSLQLNYTDNLFSYSTVIVNEELYEANGWSSYLEDTSPITTSSLYQACSISKVPFAYIVCKMADDGEIDLDTPLLEYYPGLISRFAADATTQARAAKVTPRMCITHCSGLKNDGNSSTDVKFSFEPGEQYQYSGVGISMTQWTLDYLKGTKLEYFSKDYIFNKLGMTLTNYQWQSSFAKIAPHGFSNGNRIKNTNLGSSNAAHSMRTSADEYTKFLQWVLRGGDLSKEMYTAMLSPYTHVSGNKYRALGWVLEENMEMGNIYFHTGSNGGYRANSMIVPERGASLCYFWNAPAKYSPHGDLFNFFFHNKYNTEAYGAPAIPEISGTDDNGSAGKAPVYDD